MDDLHLEYEDDLLEPLPGVGGEQLANVFRVIPLHQLVGPEKDHVYFDSHFVTIPVFAIIGMNRQHSSSLKRLASESFNSQNVKFLLGTPLPITQPVVLQSDGVFPQLPHWQLGEHSQPARASSQRLAGSSGVRSASPGVTGGADLPDWVRQVCLTSRREASRRPA